MLWGGVGWAGTSQGSMRWHGMAWDGGHGVVGHLMGQTGSVPGRALQEPSPQEGIRAAELSKSSLKAKHPHARKTPQLLLPLHARAFFFVSLQMFNILIKVSRFSFLSKSDFGYFSLPAPAAIMAKQCDFFLTLGSFIPPPQHQPLTRVAHSVVPISSRGSRAAAGTSTGPPPQRRRHRWWPGPLSVVEPPESSAGVLPTTSPPAALRLLMWAVPAGDGPSLAWPRREEAGGAAKVHVPAKKQISACVLLWVLVS